LNIEKHVSLTYSLWISAANSRIEKILLKVLDEVQKGYHEGSILSNGSVDSINTKEAWQQLRKELEEAGIDATVLNEKRSFIVELILRAKSDGTIDEADVPDFDAGSEFDTDLSTARTLIGEEYENRLGRLRSGEDGMVVEHPRSANAQKRPKKRRLGSLFRKLMGNDIRVLEAADAGDLEAIIKLSKQKANLQTTDKWDWTALHMAAYGGYDEMTKVLIEEGADLNAKTVDDETPRDLAEIKGRVGVVRIIEEEEIRRANKAQLERGNCMA
jgi:ankyrin repeat protein